MSPVSLPLPDSAPQTLADELAAIIDGRRLTILFQPIVAIGDGGIYGYEALTRGPSDSPLHAPLSLFDAAHRGGRLLDLEMACWQLAVRSFVELGLPGRLFLNTSPLSFSAAGRPLLDSLRDETCRTPLAPERLVVEITEQYPIDDIGAVLAAAADYRSAGLQLAIDDLGAGYAGLRLWSELRPDYIKVDSHFLQRIHEDPVKQEFVRSIRDIALGTKSRVIVEGIETCNEYRVIHQLGIGFGQGYFFSRPKNRPPLQLPPGLLCPEQTAPTLRRRLSATIAGLAVEVPTITSTTTVEMAVALLHKHPEVHTLPVLEDTKPVGVIRRGRVMELLMHLYGRELYGRRAVTRIMDRTPLLVEHDLPVERVSQKVTGQLNFNLENDFIITRHGQYMGIGLVRDLLKKITELQIRNARYANPLTLLPGNVPINEHIDHLLERQAAFTVCYCDLDHFKPYNDSYGYQRGDEVIQKVAQILSAHLDAQRDFLGHIGGDDFILIFESADWQERCAHILRHFARDIGAFYSEQDLAQGGLWGHDRQGHPMFFPLLSVSLGAVSPDPAHCRSYHQVAALASDAKKQAKKQPGNSLFLDRRRSPPESTTAPVPDLRVACAMAT